MIPQEPNSTGGDTRHLFVRFALISWVFLQAVAESLIGHAADQELGIGDDGQEVTIFSERTECAYAAALLGGGARVRRKQVVELGILIVGRGDMVHIGLIDAAADFGPWCHVGHSLAQWQQFFGPGFLCALLLAVDAEVMWLVDGGLKAQNVELVVHLDAVAVEPVT
jgi:hypothetical protein